LWLEELGEKVLGDLGGIAIAVNVNGPDGIRDIEGKVTRVGASERGQRMSFKWSARAMRSSSLPACGTRCWL
jgi:hypothetical protein